jgi:hypothetical protein
MAAPVYATDLTDIIVDMASTTGWTALGGGAGGLVAPETDFYIQGSNCISKAGWSTAVKGMVYLAGAGVTVPTDGAVMMWIYYWAPNAMDTYAGGGMRMVIGSSAAAYYEHTVAGSDKLPFAGWFLGAVNPNTATPDFTVGTPTATEQSFGATIDVPAAGPSKGQPLGIDAIRYGRTTLTMTNGDLANGYATFAGAQAYGDAITRRWGQLSERDGAYFMSGFMSLGSSATAVDFRDSNKILFIRDHTKVTAAFNRIEVLNAASNVDWDNIQITALGTNSPGTFVHTAGAFDAINCQFTGMGTFTFLDASSAVNCTFRRCGQIIAPGADLHGSIIAESTVAANTSAVVWDVAQDPAGELDDMTFTKGTNAHHAIEFGVNSPTTITLNGQTFTGFSTSNNANDSVLHIKRTSGTVTINTSGVTGTISYRTDGATVTIVNSTTLTLTGLKNPTEVRIFQAGTTTAIAGEENVTSGTYTTGIDAATYPSVDISVIALGYQNLRLLGISTTTDRTIPIQQTIDRQYLNP